MSCCCCWCIGSTPSSLSFSHLSLLPSSASPVCLSVCLSSANTHSGVYRVFLRLFKGFFLSIFFFLLLDVPQRPLWTRNGFFLLNPFSYKMSVMMKVRVLLPTVRLSAQLPQVGFTAHGNKYENNDNVMYVRTNVLPFALCSWLLSQVGAQHQCLLPVLWVQ